VNRNITPVFIFSLPRSGSTLLQRLLVTHPEIGTISEGWILLPLVYTLRNEGAHAEFKTEFLRHAVEDICQFMPNGLKGYQEQIRIFATGLYEQLSTQGHRYFIDKTPPYSLVAQEIIQIFPNAKFIFLWRNPLAVAASVIKTWAHGRFNLFRVELELHTGLANLISAYTANPARYHSLNYEDLCANPNKALEAVHRFLELNYDPAQLARLSAVDVRGRLGDRGEMRNSPSIDVMRASLWTSVMSNPLRKRWCLRYMEWLGDDRITAMGYDPDILRADLKSAPSNLRFLVSDAARMLYGRLNYQFEFEMLARKWSATRFQNRSKDT
jgi:hypothetical protein